MRFIKVRPAEPPFRGGSVHKHGYFNIRGKVMVDAECVGRGAVQDLNSNPAAAALGGAGGGASATAADTMSCLSNASSHASNDFIQDNSDYQWFLDYGYREGGVHHHTSILSSLSESYGGPDDVGYYEALSKNLDANLAEADMESFRTEDIHALLTTLPTMCTDMQLAPDGNHQGEMFASVTGSMMEKFEFDSSMSPHSSSQGEESANSPDTMSICKSELLFSPVKETPLMPGANFSIDSLDCDLLNGEDIMLTCQANKDNYTIAFEGSMTMYSEDSYHVRENDFKNIRQKNEMNTMARSDSGLTTWSKLKKTSDNQLRKYPSGNNNNSSTEENSCSLNDNSLKSVSMPDLNKKILNRLLRPSKSPLTNSSCDSSKKSCLVKVFNISHQNSSVTSDMAISIDSANINKPQPHNFNLVKLFMKQKSQSADGMSLDQSSASEKWSTSQSGNESAESYNKKSGLKNYFEDSLGEPKVSSKSLQKYDEIQEEPLTEPTESVEELSESYNSANKEKLYEVNLNNNNSILEKVRKGTQTRHLSQNISSDATTSTESTEVLTKRKTQAQKFKNIPINLMSRSIQTSICPLKSSSGNIKVVEPSFLAKLQKESDSQRPIYVVYPSYTLPDLEFLKEKEDITKILLEPQKENRKTTGQTKQFQGRRPFSCNDMEALKRKGFSHIRDWDSLTFLLPVECRQVLSDIPEYMNTIKEQEKNKSSTKRRPMSYCDNYSFSTSNSSTTTQPSSGYRGSSTILTDSSQNSPAQTTFNPLFVYRYDSVTSSEASIGEKQVPPLPKRSISLPQGDKIPSKKEIVPPRPPLPRGILRRVDSKIRKNIANKRYSMFEMGETDDYSEEDCLGQTEIKCNKRKSWNEPYFLGQRRTFSEHSTETEDEGVEMHGTDSSLDERFENMKIRPPTPPLPKRMETNLSSDELEQLEEYLKTSGISCLDTLEWDENNLLKLRSHVSKFLSLKINKDQFDLSGKKSVSFGKDLTYNDPPPSPNVSAIRYSNKTLVDMPICEEGELSPEGTPIRVQKSPQDQGLIKKQNLVSAVTQAVEQLIHHFSIANDQGELNTLGDAELNPTCAKMVLSNLCPALYALLSDGLKPTLETPFGAINNSVWQVVEASSQQGPLTKALNELVMKINSEDVISHEGMLKFNAFVIGLLNVRSLDAWASYLRTRETVLRKHYSADSLMLLAQTGGATVRSLLDTLIATLQPLALLPFQIDLLFEYRQLHLSLRRMDSYHQPASSPTHGRFSPINHLTNKQLTLMKLVRSIQSSMSCDESEDVSIATMIKRYSPIQNSTNDPSLPELLNSSAYNKTQIREEKQRPRSCIDQTNLSQGQDLAATVKKRWSGIHMGSKFVQAFDRLATDTEEEYSDSLEHNVNRKSDDGSSGGSNKIFSYVPQLPHEDGPQSIDSQKSEDSAPLNGNKFRRLQMKWEMLSGKDVANEASPPLSPTHTPVKSKIPRPIQSPLKSSGIPVPVISPKTANKPPIKNNKVTTPPGGTIKKSITPNRTQIQTNTQKKTNVTRTSRVDQLEHPESRPHLTRPSSLPYKPVSATQGAKGSKLTPPRRAVSSSVTRKVTQSTKAPKVVKTLAHRLPSDNGHLSFNEGEKLKVILEVDSKWLLCCRGDQKGLVPRTAVIAIDTGPRS